MWISHLASKVYDKNELDMIVQSCDSIRISVDGHNEDIYNSIRNPRNKNAFKIMVKNITGLIKARQHLKTSCHIGIQMVLCKQNIESIAEMILFSEALCVDYMQVRPIELRGAHSSDKNPDVLDTNLQTYKQIYDDGQLALVENLCKKLKEESSIEIIYRGDKINNIQPQDYCNNPGRRVSRCAGSHFQIVISFDNLMKTRLRHCYFRHDLESLFFEKGELKEVLYSNMRSKMFSYADNTPLKCSSGCKYVDLNKKVESLTSLPKEESIKIISLLQREEKKLINPNII